MTGNTRNHPEIEEFLNSHHSAREFTAESISDSQVTRIIRMAERSPTSSNLQMRSVITVRNQKTRDKLAELSGGQRHVSASSVFFVFLADLNPLAEICRQRNLPFTGEYLEPFLLTTIDAALYAGRALMAAQALGLGGTLVGGIRNNPQEVANLLSLPDYCYAICGMSVGYPLKPGKLKPRLPSHGSHHREHYQKEIVDPAVSEYDQTMLETGIYNGRQLPKTDGSPDDSRTPYSWSEHSARRMSDNDPSALRASLKPFLESIGFKLK